MKKLILPVSLLASLSLAPILSSCGENTQTYTFRNSDDFIPFLLDNCDAIGKLDDNTGDITIDTSNIERTMHFLMQNLNIAVFTKSAYYRKVFDDDGDVKFFNKQPVDDCSEYGVDNVIKLTLTDGAYSITRFETLVSGVNIIDEDQYSMWTIRRHYKYSLFFSDSSGTGDFLDLENSKVDDWDIRSVSTATKIVKNQDLLLISFFSSDGSGSTTIVINTSVTWTNVTWITSPD